MNLLLTIVHDGVKTRNHKLLRSIIAPMLLPLLPLLLTPFAQEARALQQPALTATSVQKEISAEDAVRLALSQSPAVRAAQSRLEAASAGVRGARAGFPLVVEAAPGVGFTNGNALVSQRLDVGGRRRAASRQATGERAATEAELTLARLQAAGETRVAYFDLVRARTAETAAADTVALTQQLRDAVRRRVDLGEAPAVQGTRADIEVARAEQEAVRARGDALARRAVLNVLLGREPGADLTPTDPLLLPAAPAPVAEMAAGAERTRPDFVAAEARIEARRGALDVARTARRPDLFAELATDFWSLDRNRGSQFSSDRVGLQARLTFPLGGGALRAGADRASAEVRTAEAERDAVRRTVRVDIERRAAELGAAREIAGNYQRSVLPKTEELVQATRMGYETGLTSFLEVLEAQRVFRQTQAEYQAALFASVRARIALDQALGILPGLSTP